MPEPRTTQAAKAYTEWAVHSRLHGHDDKYRLCRTEQDAEDWAGSIASFHDPGDWEIRPRVMCRTVTATEWETPEDTQEDRS